MPTAHWCEHELCDVAGRRLAGILVCAAGAAQLAETLTVYDHLYLGVHRARQESAKSVLRRQAIPDEQSEFAPFSAEGTVPDRGPGGQGSSTTRKSGDRSSHGLRCRIHPSRLVKGPLQNAFCVLVHPYVSRTILQADPASADLHTMSKVVHHHSFRTTRIGADHRRSTCSTSDMMGIGSALKQAARAERVSSGRLPHLYILLGARR